MLEDVKSLIEKRWDDYESRFPDKRPSVTNIQSTQVRSLTTSPQDHQEKSSDPSSTRSPNTPTKDDSQSAGPSPLVPLRSSSSLKKLIAAAKAKYSSSSPKGATTPSNNNISPTPPSTVDGSHQSIPSKASSQTIAPENLYNILSATKLHVLVLDVRPMKEYSNGHLKWARMNPVVDSGKGVPSGVIQIEPEWLSMPNTSSTDLESYILAFNPDTLVSRNLFASRHHVDLVVYLDENSSSLSDSPLLSTLYRVIYEFEFTKILKQPPLLLAGGFQGWLEFIERKFGSQEKKEWIEQGFKRKVSKEPVVDTSSSTSQILSNYATSPYDYVIFLPLATIK